MLIAAAIAATLLTGGPVQDAPALRPPVRCDRGPLEREYGGLPWLVYSCTDGAVIFGGKPGSLADTSLFIWAPSADGLTLTLETALADLSPLKTAQTELAALTVADLQALVAETGQTGAP